MCLLIRTANTPRPSFLVQLISCLCPPLFFSVPSILYPQGARWDGIECCLTEPAPTNIFCPMPLLWLVPLVERKAEKASSHWRMLKRSLQLKVEAPGPGQDDLEGLITGGGDSWVAYHLVIATE